MFAEEIVFCQPSWVVESSTVRMSVTRLGGHMGPVQFCSNAADRSIEPYYISPWQCEENSVPVGQSEKVLRGDFFCLPFGDAGPERTYPSHGKTAGALWSLEGYRTLDGVHELSLSMSDALGSAGVRRQFFLRDGEDVVYDRTTVTGLVGAHTVGHHAVLRVPHSPSAMLISTGRQLFGMSYPKRFSNVEGLFLQSLAIGAQFDDLCRVPLAAGDGEMADLSVYPLERESTDLIQLAVAAEDGQPAWTSVVNTQEGYLWFALRDAAAFPSTLMWIENRARKFSPWDGRTCVLGLEDVCSFFDMGSEVSREENAFSMRGIKTVHEFGPEMSRSFSYIQGAVRIPPGFGRVHNVKCLNGRASFTDVAGAETSIAVDANFLFGKNLFLEPYGSECGRESLHTGDGIVTG